jgi:hypothetical protein
MNRTSKNLSIGIPHTKPLKCIRNESYYLLEIFVNEYSKENALGNI